jgi:hypothetical protein
MLIPDAFFGTLKAASNDLGWEGASGGGNKTLMMQRNISN